MRIPRLRRPSPAMLVAVVALVVALEGPAIADQAARIAKSISGSSIKKRSIPGNRLKANSVTGAQVREKTLSKVPAAVAADNAATAADAQKLGGRTPSAFLPAGGKAVDADKLDGVDASGFLAKGQRMSVAWIVVASNGTILRQSGGWTVEKLGTGGYLVDHPALDESKIGYAGSVFREAGAGTAPGFVSMFANTAAGFHITTADASGASKDSGFSVLAPLVDASGNDVGRMP